MRKTAMRWGGSASRDDAADLRYAKPTPRRNLGTKTMLKHVAIAGIGLLLATAAAGATKAQDAVMATRPAITKTLPRRAAGTNPVARPMVIA